MPGAQISPTEVGTEAGGFRVTGTPQVTLRIELWGYWMQDVATAFGRETATLPQKLAPTAVLILDGKNLKPQGAEGQAALRVFMRSLSGATFAKGIVIAESVLTRMQLTRLVREAGLDGRVGFGDTG